MYTGTLCKREDQLGIAWIPMTIGVGAVGGIVATAWALIRGEDRRKQTINFYKTQMGMLVGYMATGPYPKFLEAVAGFDMSMFEALNTAIVQYDKKVFWASPSTQKVNVLLFTSKDGKALVICDKVRDVASIVADDNSQVNWDTVRAMISTAASNNGPKGWFRGKWVNDWNNQIYKIQSSGTPIAPISQVVPRVTQALSAVDLALLVAGLGTIGILGYKLLKGKKSVVASKKPEQFVVEPKSAKMEMVKV